MMCVTEMMYVCGGGRGGGEVCSSIKYYDQNQVKMKIRSVYNFEGRHLMVYRKQNNILVKCNSDIEDKQQKQKRHKKRGTEITNVAKQKTPR